MGEEEKTSEMMKVRARMKRQWPAGEFPLWNSLPWEDEGRASAESLMRLFGCKHKRHLQDIIARERKKGAVIVGSKAEGGYFRTADRDLLLKAYKEYARLAAIEGHKMSIIRKVLEIPAGQQGLDLESGGADGQIRISRKGE